MAKLSLMIETDDDRVDARGAGGSDALRHAPTDAVYVAVPVAGLVKVRFSTSAPAAVVSTVSQEPRVNLNSMEPRTSSGSVIAYVLSGCRVSANAGAFGFQRLNDPAT
jgi:hypothetical protein